MEFEEVRKNFELNKNQFGEALFPAKRTISKGSFHTCTSSQGSSFFMIG